MIALARTPESVVKLFNKEWSRALKEDNYVLKYLCRMLFFRILLNYSQETNYLDRLSLANSDAYNRDSGSYARKVATYLHNKTTNDESGIYISFPEIIKSVLQKPFFSENEVLKSQIKDLANVLFTMSLSRSTDTNWNALIVIKFGYNTSCSANDLYEKMVCLWEEYQDNKSIITNANEYAIKLTPAGNFYAQIVPTFEYYACRFNDNYKPLIAIANNDECEELLNIVMKRAFFDIDNIVNEDKIFIRSMGQKEVDFSRLYYDVEWLYRSKNRNAPDVHPGRILRQHIGYLDNYRKYIQSQDYSSGHEFQMPHDTCVRLRIIEDTIQMYINKATSIEKMYPHYIKPIKYVRGD